MRAWNRRVGGSRASAAWMRLCTVTAALLLFACCVDDANGQIKPLPPPGIKLEPAVAQSLKARVEAISGEIDRRSRESKDASSWRSDVEVLVRAVRLALDQDIFYSTKEVEIAGGLLDEARRRLDLAARGRRGLALLVPAKTNANEPTLVVGGFRSKIDDSVQPYGLVVPRGFQLSNKKPHRLDVWLHGRGDNKTEIAFLNERMTKVGDYAPADTFVLHPFGRHCNAFKFAGETDVYEAIEQTRRTIPIDAKLISIRGFSMGGAGCWHLAAHDPGAWFAANPGAGFVDTMIYQGWDKKPPYEVTDVRQRVMRWYDVLPKVNNFRGTRLIAYSGEVDKQRQAADLVQAEAKTLGVPMLHVIGAGMGHKIDGESAKKIDAQLATWAKEVTGAPRREIDFTTVTLRYPGVDWLTITGLEQHWEPSRVRASIAGGQLSVTSEGVTSMKLDFGAASESWAARTIPVTIDGVKLSARDDDPAKGFQCHLRRGDTWMLGAPDESGLRKRPGLQGPIDDAFCDRFLFVVPSRPAIHGAAQRWIDREIAYAQQRWRGLMRGEVRVVEDSELTAEQIASSHLICFGDFFSNRYLAEVAAALPITWDKERLQVGSQTFDPVTHVAAFCYPNPKNPNRYLVVNSGMTFRDFSNTSNSRQIAMLGDWAVMDVSESDDSVFAGDVVAEGLFDEQWKLASPSER